MKMTKATIETISQGAAVERANLELNKVLANIMDENTSPIVVREVTLKIKIKPSEDRTVGAVTIQAMSKLAPVRECVTQVFIGKDIQGNLESNEVVQPSLFPELAGNVTPIKKQKEGTND